MTSEESDSAIEAIYDKRGCGNIWRSKTPEERKAFIEDNPMWNDLLETVYEKSSVLCLYAAKPEDSNYMFEHYADNHKGICIEFHFSVLGIPCGLDFADWFLNYKLQLLKVNYSDTPPVLNYLLLRDKTDLNKENIYQNMLGTKRTQYMNEREYRIFRWNMPAGSAQFEPSCLKRIIFGMNTPKEDIDEVKNWLKDWPTAVEFAQVKAINEESKLDILPI